MDFPVYTNIINLFFFLLLSSWLLLFNTPKKDTNVDRIWEQDSESSEKKIDGVWLKHSSRYLANWQHAPPSPTKFEDLKKKNRMKEITFTKKTLHNALDTF